MKVNDRLNEIIKKKKTNIIFSCDVLNERIIILC